MPVPLDQFVKQLEDSGILAGDTLGDFLPPKASPKDAEDLARELVRQKKLTKYQAEEVYKGKGKSLTLGNYVLMEKIGAGGMGQVFKAEHRRMHRMVAIKLLPAAMTKNKAAIARFEREVTAAAKLRHPNIIAADDADQAGGVHFLVMELVDGSDLSALVKKNGPLPVDKAVNYILQAARGLEFAHAEGVVHRDIKPANLLLDKKGMVKILDMGLARIHGDGGQAELTSTGAVMGTVDYMAPEQALNTKTADARADIYALGCSLFYLLTGKSTYDGDTLMAKLLAHRDQPIPDLQAVCPQVPDQLEAIFKTMVAKKIDDRYQTMTAVIADLESFGGGQTVSPPSFAASDANLTNFLDNIALAEVKPVRRTKAKPAASSFWKDNKKNLLVGGGILGGLFLLAGIVFSLRTKDVQIESNGTKSSKAARVPSKPAVAAKDVKEADAAPNDSTEAVDRKVAEWVVSIGGEVVVNYDYARRIKAVSELPKEEFFVANIWLGQNQKVTDRDLPRFKGCQGLWLLDLSGTQVTDAGLAHVKDFASAGFNQLYLTNTSITDAGLAHLKDCTNINQLQISDTAVTDDGLNHLKRLNRMTALFLHRTKVTEASVRQLADELPQCNIYWDGGDIAAKSAPLETTTVAGGKPWESPDFKKWMQSVAAMPAEKQVEAVSQKLKELNPEFDGKLSSGWVESSLPVIQDGHVVELRIFTDNVADLSPIRALSELRGLSCDAKQKTGRRLDLSPLYGMKIRALRCVVDDLDLSTVKGLPLSELSCFGGGITNLTPISGMPLHGLTLSGNWELTNLEPLKGMPLTYFWCDNTKVADLSPLRGMSLKSLVCRVTQVADLSPLKGMPLEMLSCEQAPITSLLPLAEMPLKTISFSPKPELQGLRTIRRIDSLVEIGTAYDKLIPKNEFWKQYDAGAFDLPDDLKRATDVNSIKFQMWMKDVQGLRAEDQIEAVRKKLIELNPGFDGKLTDQWYTNPPVITNGSVTTITFLTDAVRDIAPVRALMGLDILGCRGSTLDRGKLRDLSPLKGMRMTHVDFGYNARLADLSPLTGSPLTHLACADTGVTDLSLLRDVPLVDLMIGNTEVSDLSPLPGMPLKALHIWGTMVTDLSPLKGMELRVLSMSGVQHLTSLSPLKGMPLVELGFNHTPISDLSPLKGMPLETLITHGSSVSDLSPLEGLNLNHLSFTPPWVPKGIDVVRRMRSLKTIGANGDLLPADEFWKKYDAGEFGKPTTD